MKRRLIILDLNLPGLGGLELLRRLIQQGAGPILMLTMHAEPLYAKRALAGAAGDRDRGELRTFF
jgi:two-component system invasion response regulator UvrY